MDAVDLDLSTGEPRQIIEAGLRALLEEGGLPLSLGGDHSVTYPILRAAHKAFPGLTVVQIDAHPDLYDAFNGDKYTHTCPFARVMEEGLADRLIQVGIRARTRHQRAQAERFGVEEIDMRAWVEGKRPEVDGPVYLSLDLDGLDPEGITGYVAAKLVKELAGRMLATA